MSHAFAAVAVSVLLAAMLPAQDEPDDPAPAGETEPTIESLLAKYRPRAGTAKVGTVAEVKLDEGWLWLDPANAGRFLMDTGNRPDAGLLGVAIPPDFVEAKTFAVYTYSAEGHVADDEQPNYDALLRDMKLSAVEQSKQRKEAGLEGVALIGWAEPPHYDKEQHKLFWAERLRFEGSDSDTLNYNVRVLGRAGHLVVNGVGDIEQLEQVAAQSKALLEVTEFVDGQRYTDFDPAYDKVAAYGIGGLIAGKMAMKVGLFAKLLKPLLAGVVILGALVVKLLRGRKKDEQAPTAA